MKRIVCYDTEDDSPELLAAGRSGFEKKVTQIAAMTDDRREYYSKGDIPGFLKWLRSQKPCIVYAHNMQYDLGNLFADSLDEIDVSMLGSRMIRAYWKGIEFRDSGNMWQCKVADIGEAFGLKKLETDVYSKKYVMRDVEIILRAMVFVKSICGKHNLADIPSTMGGLAVKIWRDLGGENWYDDSLFAREALFGGRVELFRPMYRGPLLWTDINSLYPYCMTKEFPDSCDTMNDIDGFGVAGVRIKIPEMFVCPLPLRDEETRRISYPYGRLEGIWTFHELQNAVKHGCKIERIYDAIGSKKGERYYKEFVDYCYKLKKSADTEAKRLFYKLLLNTFYGQLGTRGVISKTISALDGSDSISGQMFGSKILVDHSVPLPKHTNYLHNAYVTSYGRLELFKYLSACGSDIIYCDTDSTIFAGKKAPFRTGKELGEMRICDKGKSCYAYAPKTYVFDNDYVAKGVPKKKAEQYIKQRKTSYEQPFKYRDAIRFFDRGNIKKLSVWRTVEKELITEYDKKTLRSGRFRPKRVCNIETDMAIIKNLEF